jgi:hypothetical protein
MYQLEFHPACPSPGPGFAPKPGGAPLKDAIARFNAKVAEEKPKGAYELTESEVRKHLLLGMKKAQDPFCHDLQSVYEGIVPVTAEFKYRQGGFACTLPQPTDCYDFLPVLDLHDDHGSWSANWGIRIGHGVPRSGDQR